MSENALTKVCFKCGNPKPLTEFYAHPRMADGRLNKCKACTKKDVRANYAERRPQYSAYERTRSQLPERKRDQARHHRAYKARHPDRYMARLAVTNALRDGRLVRRPCCHCGSTLRVQAHHADYAKPLDVSWECFKCHREREHGQVVTVAAGRPD